MIFSGNGQQRIAKVRKQFTNMIDELKKGIGEVEAKVEDNNQKIMELEVENMDLTNAKMAANRMINNLIDFTGAN